MVSKQPSHGESRRRQRGSSAFAGILAAGVARDGSISLLFTDGRQATASLGRPAFEETSAIATSTYLPQTSQLHLRTNLGDAIVVDIPQPDDLAPLRDRPVVYLDQNHWSTLTNAIHQPNRIEDPEELAAATHLITLAVQRRVVLPMSSGHMSETCKQRDPTQRYQRALTLAQLSAGWQLRFPLDVRRYELRQALSARYRGYCSIPPAVVTLEPDAVHAGQHETSEDIAHDLAEDARWVLHAIQCIGGNLDALLDAEHVPVDPVPGWAAEFERFARYLAQNPTGPEMKRKRTHAKFIVDLGRELPEEAYRAGITADQMSDWTLRRSEEDLAEMPALGLFREVLHEKLCNPTMRWHQNDLFDMMYLTVAAGYCDHVVAEHAHGAYLANGARRIERVIHVHRDLKSLVSSW